LKWRKLATVVGLRKEEEIELSTTFH